MKSKILVPTDFTEVAHTAMLHAADLAESIGASIYLLNIVKDKEDIAKSTEKVENEIEYLN